MFSTSTDYAVPYIHILRLVQPITVSGFPSVSEHPADVPVSGQKLHKNIHI
jgi:hypothetical protein